MLVAHYENVHEYNFNALQKIIGLSLTKRATNIQKMWDAKGCQQNKHHI